MLRARTATLTREGRDTLWLLLALTLSLAPHLGRLPLWCSIGTALALLWRARLAWSDAPLPPRWVLFISLAASVGLTLSTHHSLFGREAGITLVTVLAALKTLELRARRDAFVVTCLGFFLAFTQFLYSQSILMALLMLLATWALLSTLVLAQRPLGRPSLGSALKAAGQSLLWGLPLMLALYVFFPRLGPLWSLPSDAGSKTGLSDQLKLGHVSELALDDTIAMRVRFEWAAPRPNQLYFRGPVLTWFDGQTWSVRAVPFRQQAEADGGPVVQAQGRTVSYQVTLEPTRLQSLPLLDGTLAASPTPPQTEPEMRRWGLDWQTRRPVGERIQVSGQAWLGARDTTLERFGRQTPFLQLPAGVNPRTLAWARAQRSRPELAQADARTVSQSLLQHIRTEKFVYTLAPDDDEPAPDGRPERHLIDRFWLDRRTGFCEHFATAYVVVMRGMGIPARVVTGFQGAELNVVDGLYVVRNSDAHAWAEFWQEGEGWVRVDPTAAVAPERIERSSALRVNPGGLAGVLGEDQGRWLRTWRAYIDAGNHRWNVWVLQYAREQQLNLLQNWGVNAHNWADLLRICAMIFAGVSLLGLSWLWWQRPRTVHSPWEHTMWQLHRSLLALGVTPPQGCPAPAPALAWAQRLRALPPERLPLDLRRFLLAQLTALDALRYAAPAPHAASPLRQAQSLVKQLRQRIGAYRRARPAPSSAR